MKTAGHPLPRGLVPVACLGLAALAVFRGPLRAAEVIRDEARVPAYQLPALLIAGDGNSVTNVASWLDRRRPELLATFAREVYGPIPPPPRSARWQVVTREVPVFDGPARAFRRDVALELPSGKAEPEGTPRVALRFTVYLPADAPRPLPAFVGLHLFDTAKPVPTPAVAVDPKSPDAAGAGERLGRRILERGYALASLDIEDLAPDSGDRWRSGALRRLTEEDAALADLDTGALSLWASGLSRALDYFQSSPDFDSRAVIAIGHSRMGKAALWAGANDGRFAAVISNDSGCGGAALEHRRFGETTAIITRAFPYWFASTYARYAGREADLPVDQHQLLALLAPRPLYVASAEQDLWADPLGEYLATVHATPAWNLFGLDAGSAAASDLPPVDQPVGQLVQYHVRRGRHDLTDLDWQHYLAFADRHVRDFAASLRGAARLDWKTFSQRPDDWFRGVEARRLTAHLLARQSTRGDWPKNTNNAALPFYGPRGTIDGTFDNGATVGELRFLARRQRLDPHPAVESAVLLGLHHLLDAQYPNGGWPQSFPPGRGYARHVTFNDHTMVNLLELAREVDRGPDFRFVDPALRRRAGDAFARGVDCILRCQVNVRGTLTVWGAQHDERTLEPRPARTFEPASLSAAESAGILRLLMSVDHPTPEIQQAIEAGVRWFREAELHGLRLVREDGDVRVVEAENARNLWARFYEIPDRRPIFAGRDGVVKYRLADIELERRRGYAWYGDWGVSVARRYEAWRSSR